MRVIYPFMVRDLRITYNLSTGYYEVKDGVQVIQVCKTYWEAMQILRNEFIS